MHELFAKPSCTQVWTGIEKSFRLLGLGAASAWLVIGCAEAVQQVEPFDYNEALDGTAFDATRLIRLPENSNNISYAEYFRCNCTRTDAQAYDLIRASEFLYATDIRFHEIVRDNATYTIDGVSGYAQYFNYYRRLGVRAEVASDRLSANLVFDVGGTLSGEALSGELIHQPASDICSVARDEGVVNVRIGDAPEWNEASFRDAAECVAVGVMAVNGFHGLVYGTAWNLEQGAPDDYQHHLVFNQNISGFWQSDLSRCLMAPFRLLPNGPTATEDYIRSAEALAAAARDYGRNQCPASRGLIHYQMQESRQRR